MAVDFANQLAENAAKPARKAERTRTAIQAATCQLLNTKTPDQLKVAEICRAAGIAHGTFYIYFKDVRAAVSDSLVAFVEAVQQVMRQVPQGREDDRIRATTEAYFQLYEQSPGLMRALVSHFDTFPEAAQAFQKLNREWTQTVVEAALRRYARKGETPPARDELLRRAYALGGMVDQYLIALLFNNDPTLASVSKDRDAVIDTLSFIWKRGLSQ